MSGRPVVSQRSVPAALVPPLPAPRFFPHGRGDLNVLFSIRGRRRSFLTGPFTFCAFFPETYRQANF